jgi:hypothetical protein
MFEMFEPHVPNLHLVQARFRVTFNVDIDGEMRVNVSHFIPKSTRNTDDQVVDQRLDGSKSSHVLSCAMMELDIYNILRGMGEAD